MIYLNCYVYVDMYISKLFQLCKQDKWIVVVAVQHPVMSDSLQPHRLQHIRPPYPSPSPEVCPSSCPLHQLCHPAISSPDALFSFCSQSFPASELFQWVSCLHQMTKHWSFSFSISLSNEYSGLISLDWLVWSPCCPGIAYTELT